MLDHVLAKLHGHLVLHEVEVHSGLLLDKDWAAASDDWAIEPASASVLSIERFLARDQSDLVSYDCASLRLLIVGATIVV